MTLLCSLHNFSSVPDGFEILDSRRCVHFPSLWAVTHKTLTFFPLLAEKKGIVGAPTTTSDIRCVSHEKSIMCEESSEGAKKCVCIFLCKFCVSLLTLHLVRNACTFFFAIITISVSIQGGGREGFEIVKNYSRISCLIVHE